MNIGLPLGAKVHSMWSIFHAMNMCAEHAGNAPCSLKSIELTATIQDTDEYKSLKGLFLPGFEPGTFCVLGKRDNHYTTETY